MTFYQNTKLLAATALLSIATQVHASDHKSEFVLGEAGQVITADSETIISGKQFLQENSKNPEVVTLADGLQYKIIEKGNGKTPKATDTVIVDYTGRLVNGKEFDSSYKRGVPAKFPVNGVIKGWTEALQLMPVGSTWELYIPANLAYGEAGAPPVIGPNEVLIFKVKLIGIQ